MMRFFTLGSKTPVQESPKDYHSNRDIDYRHGLFSFSVRSESRGRVCTLVVQRLQCMRPDAPIVI